MRIFIATRRRAVLPVALSLVLAACGSGVEPDAQASEAQGASAQQSRWGREPPRPSPSPRPHSANRGAVEDTMIGGNVIKGDGRVEDLCHAAVADEAGREVLGTERIVETGDGIVVLVNVEGASAPWLCRSSLQGEIEDVAEPEFG